MERFPSVHDLARASSQVVMKTWEGLGYYSRARNLHETAKLISLEYNGKFPQGYSQLLRLKGVGPYTAAAIASIAFGEATPVLDGNVYRFVARHFGVEKDILETKSRGAFMEILNRLIPHDEPAAFNQAIMEYGATVCRPAPDCDGCLFVGSCFAFKHQKQESLPMKLKKVKSKEEFIAYLVFEHNGVTLLRKRESGIWNGLFEFHNFSHPTPIHEDRISELLGRYPSAQTAEAYTPVKHLLTHRKLWVSFHHIRVTAQDTFEGIRKDLSLNPYSWEEVLTLPRPKVIVNHLQRVLF